MLNKEGFYENVIAVGDTQYIPLTFIKETVYPSNEGNTNFTTNEKFGDNLHSIIPIIQQSQYYIDSNSSKAKKAFKQLQSNTSISPAVNDHSEFYYDYKQVLGHGGSSLVSPGQKTREYYALTNDRLYLRQVSGETQRFSIK